MLEYELINPSDPYTFIAKDKEVAALVVAILGISYGAETRDRSNENRVPIFLFGGADGFKEWYQESFGRTVQDGMEDKKTEVADALDSFMLGKFADRKRYEAALQTIDDPNKRREFIEKWQDDRSSLNDIGSFAHEMAKRMREKNDQGT